MYHFKEDHVKVTPEWLKQKNDYGGFLTIMKGWWYEGQFKAKFSSVEWKNYKLKKEHTNHNHFSIKSVRKERWFKFSGQVDSHNLPNHHKWIYIELG